jgi:hypothetical protein
MSVQQKVGEGLFKIAVDKGGDAVRFGADVLDDLLKSGIIKKFSDFEKMSQEDLIAAYNLRQNQLEQAEKNRVFNIKLKSEAKEEIKDDFDQTLDIFDEIAQVEDAAPARSINDAVGVNDQFYKRYVTEDSIFSSDNVTWNDYKDDIRAYAIREANIMNNNPDYRNMTFEQRYDLAERELTRMANIDFLNRQLYLDYGGKSINDVGGYTTNTPQELKIQENFNVYADNIIDEFQSGQRVLPYKGQDGLVYTNAEEIKRVKEIEYQEAQSLLREKQRMKAIQDAEVAEREKNMLPTPSKSEQDITLRTNFKRAGYTGYRNKVADRLKNGVYIKRDRITLDPILDKEGKFIFLDKGKQNDKFNLEMQQKHEALTGEKLIYIEPKIPNLEKGHALMRVRRIALYGEGDEFSQRQVDQVKYPTFFTTEPRNKIHIKLENELQIVLDEIKDLSSPMLRKTRQGQNALRRLIKTRNAIVKDMTMLGVESRIFNEKTGKYRAYGKAFYDAGQLINSLKGNKKFSYIGSDFDLNTQRKNLNIIKEGGEYFLPDGFEKGGFASIEEMLEY